MEMNFCMDAGIIKYMAFIKTAECGSFTKAAELLNYSQSGISRMIGDLENEWRVSLLERNRSGVKLTSDGMRLLPYAQNICEEYRKLQMQVDDLNGLKSGLPVLLPVRLQEDRRRHRLAPALW